MFLYLVVAMVTAAYAATDVQETPNPLIANYEKNWAHLYRDMDKGAVIQQQNDMVQSASTTPQLDKNSFFIYNKEYERARLAQSGTSVFTYEQLIYPDQIWMLEESTKHPGYYYINNAYHEGFRLAKSGDSIVVYDGYYYEDQLWRFQKEGDYYRIYNKYYPTAKLAKYGKEDDKLTGYTGPDYNDQLWKLVPRFSVTEGEKVIWSIDNRQGSQPVTKSFKITTGLKLTRSETISTKVGFEYSLTASVSAGIGDFSGSVESSYKFNLEIENSVTNSEEKNWVKETQTTFTAPARKQYRVVQTILNFSSPYQLDNCSLYSHERIEED